MNRRMALGALALAVFATTSAQADAGASAWSEMNGASFRLLDGGTIDGQRIAGLEIRMPKGFKTYWRSPGDSGVPPTLDLSGSENLAVHDLMFPAPVRFADGAGGHSWGYLSDVILPLRIVAADAARPIRLVAKLDYAVCSNICIPVQGEAELLLPARGAVLTRHAADVARHLARVPERRALNDGGSMALISVAAGPKPEELTLEVAAPAAAEGLVVFVEAPSDWFVDAGKAESAGTGRARIKATIAERPKDAEGTVRLNVTLVTPDSAIEVPVTLPAK
jgi:DsbC/DsbD-like thiol-disulfide interchange protein